MKRFLLGMGLFLTTVTYSQNLKDYIFPEGIRKTTFTHTNSDGSMDENSKMVYEYLIASEGATVFVSNFFQSNVVSRTKEEYYITDTAIYLINTNTKNILSYNRENFMGYNNCFLKLPPKGKTIWWAYKQTDETSYKCSATMTKVTISNLQYDAIRVDETPFENGKYLDKYKTSLYYVKGKGLYKEELTASKKPMYVLYSTEFDVSNSTIHEPTPDPTSKTDTIKIDLQSEGITAYKAHSYSDGTDKGETVKLQNPTYFIFQGKNVYLIKNSTPLKHWTIIETNADPDGEEIVTKEGETLFIFGFVSIFNKEGGEIAYDGDFCSIDEVELNSKYVDNGNDFQFGKVEIEAEFPGGNKKYIPFLYKNLVLPKAAEDNSVNGTVMVRFVVKEDGSIENIEVEKSLGYGCDEEAIRIVKLFPKWIPAMNNGKNVASIRRLPISFQNAVTDNTKPPSKLNQKTQGVIDLNEEGLSIYRVVSSFDSTSKQATDIKEPTFFIWGAKKVYLIKNRRIEKEWQIIKEMTTEADIDYKAKTNDGTIYIYPKYRFISITDLKGDKIEYRWEYVNASELEIDTKYLKK